MTTAIIKEKGRVPYLPLLTQKKHKPILRDLPDKKSPYKRICTFVNLLPPYTFLDKEPFSALYFMIDVFFTLINPHLEMLEN